MSKTIDVAKYLIYAYEQISNSRFETQELAHLYDLGFLRLLAKHL